MTPFRTVPMEVARNPVARAVSRKALTDAIRDFQIRLHLMNDGDDATGDVEAAVRSLTVCLFAMEAIGQADHSACRVMRGAQSALIQCAARGFRWRSADATAVDQGMQCVSDIYPQLPATVMTAAWKRLHDMDDVAEQMRTRREAAGAEA